MEEIKYYINRKGEKKERRQFYRRKVRHPMRLLPKFMLKPFLYFYLLFFLTVGAPLVFVFAAFATNESFISIYKDTAKTLVDVWHGEILY